MPCNIIPYLALIASFSGVCQMVFSSVYIISTEELGLLLPASYVLSFSECWTVVAQLENTQTDFKNPTSQVQTKTSTFVSFLLCQLAILGIAAQLCK